MKRREFIALVGGGAAAWPAIGRAQQSGRIRRIGVLMAAAESDRQVQSRLAVFRGELQKLGWPGISMETRYFASSDAETVQRYAKELVALQPDLLLSQNTNTTDAQLQQTRIPSPSPGRGRLGPCRSPAARSRSRVRFCRSWRLFRSKPPTGG